MQDKNPSLSITAKRAGLLYLGFFITALYAHIYVPSQLLVRDDARATMKNILSNEFVFRTCIVANLLEAIVLLFLVLTLFRLFKQVNSHLARVMVGLVVVQVPVTFVLAAFKITSL